MVTRRRQQAYFVLMGTCLTLFVLAWSFVRLQSVGLAIAMSAVAAVLPPVAVIVANYGATRAPPPQVRQGFRDKDDL